LRILIVGAGHVGSSLASLLAVKGNEVIVVDKDAEKCSRLANEVDVLALARDATDPALYEEVDLSSLDVVVAVTDRDELNLFISTIARDYGVPRIIARVKNPRIARLLEHIGVEHAITEPHIIAKLIEATIEGRYHAVELAPVFTGNYVLASITITESDSSLGKRLSEIPFPREGVRIIAIFDGEELRDPDEVSELQRGYHVVALVRNDKLEEFLESFR
jgi:trk system potassium uptake protein TrkA